MDQRVEFVDACLASRHPPIKELADLFGISEKSAHKWLTRFREGGLPALADQSRRPRHCAHATSPEVKQALIALRKKHPKWGPKKLVELLEVDPAPAPSTAGAILKAEGLVEPRRRSRRVGAERSPFAPAVEANDTWAIDHKGEFTVQRQACYPLTLSDAVSRYLLACVSCRSTAFEYAGPILKSALREFGLPRRVRSDNGPPFGARGLGGLSKMSIYLAHLGIEQEFITPGEPQDNGTHERIHRTMKAEAIAPPGSSWLDQQRAFDEFKQVYNHLRPHEALGMETPGQRYAPSPRRLPARLPEFAYHSGFAIRRVRRTGEVKWKGQLVFLSETLVGEDVGLLESDVDGWWELRAGNWDLGLLGADGALIRRKRARWIAAREPTPGATAVSEKTAGRGEPLPAPIPQSP